MRKLLMVSAALTVLAIDAAHAADLAMRQPVYRAPAAAAPGFTWTGIYIGGNGGCGADKKDYVTGFADADPGEPGSAFVFPTSYGGGCFGGGQIGMNYQFSNWVVGIEADGSWGLIQGSGHVLEPDPAEVEVLGLYEQKLTALGTVRGRLGYASTWEPRRSCCISPAVGLGLAASLRQLVVAARERGDLLRQQPDEDLTGLFEPVAPLAWSTEFDAVRTRLLLVPASADTELEPAA